MKKRTPASYLDEEAATLLVKNGAYLVPTIMAFKFTEEQAKVPGYFPQAIVKR